MAEGTVSMKFQLRRHLVGQTLLSARQVGGLFLPTRDVATLLQLCQRLGGETWPRIHALADGFLICLSQPLTQSIPGVIRLQRVGHHLYLPVDAVLLPALLEEEARALCRERGLLFLPGERVLAFHVDKPVSLGELLHAGEPRRRDWRPLPQAPALAEHLDEIIFEQPEASADDVLAPGGEGIGVEKPRPPGAGVPRQLAGRASIGMGRALAWLGMALGMKGLARAGAKMIAGGLNLAPRLSEKLLGKQEAALRELLRQFREGNVEAALRRALPLGGLPDRGAVPGTGWQLPFHNLLYSLGSLLGGDNRGPASVWFVGGNIQGELYQEYRRQAELATQRGDYRRAAFIYGKLLGDYRMAANVLCQGRLFLDAAVLFLKKLDDRLAAATAYEHGGDVERALDLYREIHEHERAGDLLRRVGAEEQAIGEYHVAARRCINDHEDYARAGEILFRRAGRPDLALDYFRQGWQRRDLRGALPCARRLAEIWADRIAVAELRQLLGEAERYLGTTGGDAETADFFQHLLSLTERQELASLHEEFRDRALMILAGRLRQRSRAGQATAALVTTLFGRSASWSPALVSDASFAVRTLRPAKKTPALTEYPTVSLPGGSFVTAAVCAGATGELFVGYENGAIAHYDPRTGSTELLPSQARTIGGTFVAGESEVIQTNALAASEGPVRGMGVSLFGELLVAIRGAGDIGSVTSYYRHASQGFRHGESREQFIYDQTWISPTIAKASDFVTLLGNPERLMLLGGTRLVPYEGLNLTETDPPIAAGLLLEYLRVDTTLHGSLLWSGLDVVTWGRHAKSLSPETLHLGWSPEHPSAGGMRQAQLSWLPTAADEMEIAGVSAAGVLCWSRLKWNENGVAMAARQTHRSPAGSYFATAIIRGGYLAAVRENAVDWIRCGVRGVEVITSTPALLHRPVACFPHYSGQELSIVRSNGTVVRVPIQAK